MKNKSKKLKDVLKGKWDYDRSSTSLRSLSNTDRQKGLAEAKSLKIKDSSYFGRAVSSRGNPDYTGPSPGAAGTSDRMPGTTPETNALVPPLHPKRSKSIKNLDEGSNNRPNKKRRERFI